MTKHIEKLAVLFADICGSTALYDRLGDEIARHSIESCINTMIKEVSAYQGTLVKTIGDEIMCTFPSAEVGLRAACAIQSAVKSTRFSSGNIMRIRVGLHYGDVICEANDVFGDTVNVAARVTSVSKADQIVLSQAVFDTIPADLKNKTRQIMAGEFKGKQEQQEIFNMLWDEQEEEAHTNFVPAARDVSKSELELNLAYRDETYKINKNCRGVTIGRGNSCDIVVENEFASRQHARIELRFGKFFLIDESTNGTYLRFADDNNPVCISRQEIVLVSSGLISLGQADFDNQAKLIKFAVGA